MDKETSHQARPRINAEKPPFPQAGLFIHVGSGLLAPPSWLNIDGSWNVLASKVPGLRPTLRLLGVISVEAASYPWPKNVRFHNVRSALPVGDNSAAAIYASHLLEHLSRQTAARFLSECHRVLTHGGRLRLVVPNLSDLVELYLRERRSRPYDRGPADRFMERLNVCRDHDGLTWPMRLYRAMTDVISHKWMYDEASLIRAVQQAGFEYVERRAYLDSDIPRIAEVERRSSFEHACCVEGVRC